MSSRDHPRDVRMRGFASRTTVEQAVAWIDSQTACVDSEILPLASAAGRVLADGVYSQYDVPAFDRAMMDGFAVLAADTLGATAYNRLALTIVGECLPGGAFAGQVAAGQAVRIMTGAPMPRGADAVVPAEFVEIDGDRILLQADVPPGKHVGRRGEDVRSGDEVLPFLRMLRPQDLGVLSSIGVAQVAVVRRPRVRIVVSGDELLPAGSPPHGNRIPDANGPMLAALVERDGGQPINPGIVADSPDEILAALADASDLTIVAGGSSVGQEDHAPMLLARHGELWIHGIAMRPSSPTGMGLLDGRIVILLPGNPVSCLCGYDFFAGRAVRALGGRPFDWPYRAIRLPLAKKISSVIGRVDYARVRIAKGTAAPMSTGGASILSSATRADGFVVVAADSEGHAAGTEVQVFLYDPLALDP